MKFRFNLASLQCVKEALDVAVAKQEFPATVEITVDNDCVLYVTISKWGTSKLGFKKANPVEGWEDYVLLVLGYEKIALTHKPLVSKFKAYVEAVVKDAGGVVLE